MPSPRALICLTGSELTRGETRDLNGSFLATGLTQLGVEVEEIRLVPDDRTLIAQTLKHGIDHYEITLVSGGLGPTADDLTIEILAEVTQRSIHQDPIARDHMLSFALKRWKSESDIPENYFLQAEVLDGSKVFQNPVGLAPACLIDTPKGFLVTLPGVPRELHAIFNQSIVQEVGSRFKLVPPRIYRAKIFNVPESLAEARIQNLGITQEDIEYGISAKPGELTIKLVARKIEAHEKIDQLAHDLKTEFGEDFLGLPEGLLNAAGERIESSIIHIVHELLLTHKLKVSTAESCTGGGLAKKFTDLAGSSNYFIGSVIAYQNEIKAKHLGVSTTDLEQLGAVSEPVCQQMAAGAQQRFETDYAIGITGIAGPGGGSEEKPVGLVYIGLAKPNQTVDVKRFIFNGDRERVRSQTIFKSLDMLRRAILASS